MWLGDHAPSSLACAYVAAAGAAAVLWLRSSAPKGAPHSRIADTVSIYAVGALAWPFVWSLVCSNAMRSMPWFASVGLAWPPLLLLVDVAFAQHQAGQDAGKHSYGMQVDGNTLSGLALTMGGVLARYVSSDFASAAGPVLMATVLLTLLFVVPTPVMHADSAEANSVRAAQKVALQYCLGFTITSVAVAFSVGMKTQ